MTEELKTSKSEIFPQRRLKSVLCKFQHDLAINDIRILSKHKERNKLSMNSMMYIEIISARNGKYTASTLAETLHIAKPSVTQKLKELEKEGYIYKKQDEKDKRIFYLYAVKKHNEVTKEIEESDLKVEMNLLKNFDRKDIEKFYDILEFMGENYRENPHEYHE